MTRFGTKNKPIVPYFKLQVSGWFDDGRLQLNLKIRVDLLTSRGYRRREDFILLDINRGSLDRTLHRTGDGLGEWSLVKG